MTASKDDSPIAFIGLGAMGFAMSTHLVSSGYDIMGYDVYEPTLERWKSTCSSIPKSRYSTANSPSEAVKSSFVTILMVATHAHVDSALFTPSTGAVHSLPQNSTVIICATVPPTYPSTVRQRLTNDFSRPDIKLIDAPVSGGTARSKNGTLTIMASSDDPSNLDASTHAVQILHALSSQGSTLYTIPGGLGSGTSAKALNQVMCGAHIVSASEIMGLAAILGLNTSQFYKYITTSSDVPEKRNQGWTWMFENRCPRMLTSDPPNASATAIINKDVGIIRDEETRLGIDLPLLNTASGMITEAMERDLAMADDSAIVKLYLGLGSEHEGLVVKQAEESYRSMSDVSKGLDELLAAAHAMISLNAAYETVLFAQALGLTSTEQRRRWFSIIAGAAGGAPTFSRVIPRVFEVIDGEGLEVGFEKYVKEVFGHEKVEVVRKEVLEKAKAQGFEAKLLEAALQWVQKRS